MKTFDELPDRKSTTDLSVRRGQRYDQYLKDLELLWHRGEKGWGLIYDASGVQEEDALITRRATQDLRSARNRDKPMDATSLVNALKGAAFRQGNGYRYEFRARGTCVFGRYTGGA